MKNNKKGISAIVATVLIILITVAAVTIIWAAIIPMISENIKGSTECFDASAALSVTTDFSCVTHVDLHCGDSDGLADVNCDASAAQADETTCVGTNDADTPAEKCVWTNNSVQVQVHRTTGNFVLKDVEIITGAGGSTESTTVSALGKVVPDVNGDKVYTIIYTGDKVTEAGVAAIVAAGNTEKTCDKSGMVKIPDCL